MSLSERVKRRRRQVSYAEDEDSDSADTPVANGGDGDFQTPMSRKFTSRHAVIEEENGRSEGRSEEASQSEGELFILYAIVIWLQTNKLLLKSSYCSRG